MFLSHIVFQPIFPSHIFIEMWTYLALENKAFMGSYNMLSIPVITLIAFPCTCSSFNSTFMNTEEQNATRYSSTKKKYINAFLSVLSIINIFLTFCR